MLEMVFSSQKVDHFNVLDQRVYSQRYFVNDTFWRQPDGPIILYLCGEAPCNGLMASRQFPVTLAQTFGAKIIAVEHRFFGTSLPFNDLTVESLKYLNSKQALADLANFIQYYQTEEINQPFNLPENNMNQWISLGGSYAGGLNGSLFYVASLRLTINLRYSRKHLTAQNESQRRRDSTEGSFNPDLGSPVSEAFEN